MNDQVLLFHFTDAALISQIRLALLPLKIRVRVVETREYQNTLGYLSGVPGHSPALMPYTGPELESPMLVLCMPNSRIDAVLAAFRKTGVPPLPYKAMLTPTNSSWTPPTLFTELQRERNEILKMQKK